MVPLEGNPSCLAHRNGLHVNRFRIKLSGQVGIEERKHERLYGQRQNNEKIENVDQLTSI